MPVAQPSLSFMAPPGKINSADLAEHFKCTQRAVRYWLKAGCPGLELIDKEVVGTLAQVESWLVETGRLGADGLLKNKGRGKKRARTGAQAQARKPEQLEEDPVSLAEARRRKELALAQKYELELLNKKGKLLDAEAVKRSNLKKIEAIKAGLYSMKARLVGELEGLSARQIDQRLEEEIERVLLGWAS